MLKLFLSLLFITNIFAFNQDELRERYEQLNLEERKQLHLVLIKHQIKRELRTHYHFDLEKISIDQTTSSHFLLELSDLFMDCAHAADSNLCHFGGWISLMNENNECLAPWQQAVRNNETIRKFGPIYNGTFSCGGANLFRCNPIIFGPGPDDGDGNGICASANDNDPRDSSRACLEAFLADPGYRSTYLLKLANEPELLADYLHMIVETIKFCDGSNNEFPYCSDLKAVLTQDSINIVQCTNRDQLIHYLPQVMTSANLTELDKIIEQLGTDTQAYLEEFEQKKLEAMAHNRTIYEEAIKAYQQDPRTLATMERLKENTDRCISDTCPEGMQSKDPYVSMLYCARYMKHAFFPPNGGEAFSDWSNYPWGTDAVQSDNWLKVHGFVNLMNDPTMADLTPENAPPGAIIVYEEQASSDRYIIEGQSRGGPGHIEMKLNDKEYISDFISDEPTRLGGERTPIGIYIHMPGEFASKLQNVPELADD